MDDKQECAITNPGAASRQAQLSKDKAMEVLILENHLALCRARDVVPLYPSSRSPE